MASVFEPDDACASGAVRMSFFSSAASSTYPASPESTNLRIIPHLLRELSGCDVGELFANSCGRSLFELERKGHFWLWSHVQ
ncbi:hypothetical protein ACFL5J_01175 [Thermodesulfobacteriota bacterium]